MACYLEETQIELLDAIMFDDYETVSNLLRSGVNPNFSTSDLINGETTPLHSAVRRNKINIVSILLDHNANVDSTDEDGDTPLYSALSADIDRDIRHLLYARGANVNHINKSGKTPLLQILEDHIFIDTDFHREAVFELHNKSNNFQKDAVYGQSLLYFVSSIHPSENNKSHLCGENHRCVEYLKLLHSEGIDISKANKNGKTVLHSLASVCCHAGFEYISENEVSIDVKLKDINGHTVLHTLGTRPHYQGFSRCLDWLLERGCHIDVPDLHGRTLFHYVCNSDYTYERAVTFLIERGASVTVTDNRNLNLLHMCVMPTFMRLQTTDPEDDFPSRENATNVLQILLSLGLDINARDDIGHTALHHSIRSRNLAVIEKLLQLGADPNLKTSTGESAIHRATIYQDVFQTLVSYTQYDLDMNEPDNFGSSPLHWAVKYLEKPVVEYLIKLGADTNLKDGLGYTARETAYSQKFTRFYDTFDITDNRGQCSNDETEIEAETHDIALQFKESSGKNTQQNTSSQKGVPTVSVAILDDDVDSESTEEDLLSDTKECKESGSVFPDCPILSTIYYCNKEVRRKPWVLHLFSKHRIQLAKFIRFFVLDTKFMGLYFDTQENLQVAEAIEDVMSKVAKAVRNLNPLLSCEVSVAGSWAEGTKVTQPSEFDYKWTLINFKDQFTPEETTEPPLGYVRLKVRPDSPSLKRGFSKYVDADGYVDSQKVICDLYGAINKVLHCGDTENTNLYLQKYLSVDKGSIDNLAFRWVGAFYKDLLIDLDIVPAVEFPNWRSKFVNLNSKLAKKFVQDFTQSVVFKAPPRRFFRNWNKLFRISVSDFETSILKKIPCKVKKGFIMLKSLKDTLYFPQVFDERVGSLIESSLTTYMLKTCFLHVLEKAATNPDSMFDLTRSYKSNEVAIIWAKRTLYYLEDTIQNHELHSFFIDGVNLLINDSVFVFNDMPIWEAVYECMYDLMSIGTQALNKC